MARVSVRFGLTSLTHPRGSGQRRNRVNRAKIPVHADRRPAVALVPAFPGAKLNLHCTRRSAARALRPASAPHRGGVVEDCSDQHHQRELPRKSIGQTLAPPKANFVMPQ